MRISYLLRHLIGVIVTGRHIRSIKLITCTELVPSSARSTTSAATQLPPQFVPLLADTLEQVKQVISTVLPVDKKRTALEEAEYEDDDEVGALEREMMLQCECCDH